MDDMTKVKEPKDINDTENTDDLLTKEDLAKECNEELWALKLVTGEEVLAKGYWKVPKEGLNSIFIITGSMVRLMANPVLVRGNLAFQKTYVPWVHEAHTQEINSWFVISSNNQVSKKATEQFYKTTTGLSIHGTNEIPSNGGHQ